MMEFRVGGTFGIDQPVRREPDGLQIRGKIRSGTVGTQLWAVDLGDKKARIVNMSVNSQGEVVLVVEGAGAEDFVDKESIEVVPA